MEVAVSPTVIFKYWSIKKEHQIIGDRNVIPHKPAKSKIKRWAGLIHLWLGLASGLIVLIVSITGCIFVFQEEISEALHRDMYFVTPQQKPMLPLSVLQQKAQAALGSAHPVQYITAYNRPGNAWEFMSYKANDTALTYFGSVEYYQSAFINPYDGTLTGIKDYKYDFFNIVKYIHWSLLLNTPYGQPIVGWSTLVFVIALITGLILWWPKRWNKANRNRSFKIKWKARFRRLNYDLHNVLGFYSLLLALVIVLTGMVWSFEWFGKLVYAAAAGTTSPPPVSTAVSDTTRKVTAVANPVDIAYQEAVRLMPEAKRFSTSPAETPEAPIMIYGYKSMDTYYGADELQFDQYSGALLGRRNAADRNRGERLIEMNYDIHVGAIGGLVGKIIAFVISLICASLPVTGFLFWLGRKRKRHLPLKAESLRPKAKNNALQMQQDY